MSDPGLVGEGRDSRIFEHGPGLVCKRAREPRSLAYEANAMELARGFGVPVPKVHEVLDDGRAIVMERVDGPTLLDYVQRKPWALRTVAAVLGELADAVHRVPAPTWLRAAEDAGRDDGVLLHLDLHPLNVIMAPQGPVLIDWANAGRGSGATDDALTWILIATGEPPPGGLAQRALVTAFRGLMVRLYLRTRDRATVDAALPHAAALRICGGNTTDTERANIAKLLERSR